MNFFWWVSRAGNPAWIGDWMAGYLFATESTVCVNAMQVDVPTRAADGFTSVQGPRNQFLHKDDWRNRQVFGQSVLVSHNHEQCKKAKRLFPGGPRTAIATIMLPRLVVAVERLVGGEGPVLKIARPGRVVGSRLVPEEQAIGVAILRDFG